MKKGQIFVADAVAAITLFLLMILIITFFLNDMSLKIAKTPVYSHIEQTSEFVADAVYKDLAYYSVFDNATLVSFFQKNLSQVASDYEIYYNFSIKVVDMAGTVVRIGATDLSMGYSDVVPMTYSISSYRAGVIGQTKVKLVVKTWQ
jgi:Zn-dependent protease with chaperone function